jgi:acetolactate synthase-1/2/3 large subunit
MKSSDLLVKCLEAEGVEYIFGLPGEENEDLLFSIEDSSIKFITTRHEQGAAFMANVYGRLTGKAGVCLSTLGPGAMNLITGLADAHLDKSPVVAITGQGELSRAHKEAHQMIDVVEIFKPLVKWNCQIDTALIIPEAVRKAFKLAQMEKPGVTHIELPEDIAKIDVDKSSPIASTKLRRAAPDAYAIDIAIEILSSATHPVILAGNGAIRKRSAKDLRSFAESFGIPAISSFMGKGAMSDSHDLSLHSIGLQVKDYPVLAFEKADVIISIGFDIAELYPKTLELINPNKDKKIIHIDFEPSEIYEYYQPNIEIVADISESLRHLVKGLVLADVQRFAPWTQEIKRLILKDHSSYKIINKFTVPGMLNVLRDRMHAEDILISDVGAHKMWIGRNWPTYKPGTVIISNGMASMGIALPGAIAAKLAKPNHRVVCINGDGGFMMNSQELETAKRLGLAFTVIIVNDDNYGLISMKQTLSKGKTFSTKISNPDFVKYAQSFGINAFRPTTADELDQVLDYCLNNNELNVVEVRVDGSENIELINKLKQI